MILDEILTHKRAELTALQERSTRSALESRARARRPAIDFAESLRGKGVSLIAEVKRASPSRGALALGLRVESIVKTYAENGASALSILTDERFFAGRLADLETARKTLDHHQMRLPVLRKDFVIDPSQVIEARAAGADAVLLIARVLSDEALRRLVEETRQWGMTPLIEAHDEDDIDRALRLDPAVVGINSRNLSTFETDPSRFGRLCSRIPDSVIVVAESGIRSAADVIRAGRMGADAVLVGEALVTAFDVGAKVRELVRGGTR